MNEHEQYIDEQLSDNLEDDESIEHRAIIYTGPGLFLRILSRLSFGIIGLLMIGMKQRQYYAASTDRRIFLIETTSQMFSFGKTNLGIHSIGYGIIEEVEESSFLNHRKMILRREDGKTAKLRANLWFNKISDSSFFFDNVPERIRSYDADLTGGEELSSPTDKASLFSSESNIGRYIATGIKWFAYAGILLLVLSVPYMVWQNQRPNPYRVINPKKHQLNIVQGGPGASHRKDIYGYEKALKKYRSILKNKTSNSWNPVTIIWEKLNYSFGRLEAELEILIPRKDGEYIDNPIFYHSGNTVYVSNTNRGQVLTSSLSASEIRDKLAPLMKRENAAKSDREEESGYEYGENDSSRTEREDQSNVSQTSTEFKTVNFTMPENFKRITFKAQGLSLAVPNDWEKTSLKQVSSPLEDKDDKFRENCNITSRSIPRKLSTISIDRLFTVLEAQFKEKLNSYKRIKRSGHQYPGFKAVRWTLSFRLKKDNSKVFERTQVFKSGSKLYQVVCAVKPDLFSDYKRGII
ncbi:MAG: hypothetical protein ABEJ65_02255 [bacterium]